MKYQESGGGLGLGLELGLGLGLGTLIDSFFFICIHPTMIVLFHYIDQFHLFYEKVYPKNMFYRGSYYFLGDVIIHW